MRSRISPLTILLAISLCPALSLAQTAEPPLVPGARAPGQKTTTLDHLDVEDGGAHGSILESIIVPPKAKAPFTLILETT